MGMGERWRDEWEVFRRAQPGRRFRERYERMKALERPAHQRLARSMCGIVTVLVGLVLVPLPGPGWLIVGFGATLLAQESRPVARFCDGVEVRFRALGARWRRWRARKGDGPRT